MRGQVIRISETYAHAHVRVVIDVWVALGAGLQGVQ